MLLHSTIAAARAMDVSQSSVSRSISAMEQEIGFVLFTRDGNRMKPTADALRLFGIVEKMSDGLDEVGRTAMAIRSQQVRDLVQLYAMSTGQPTRGMPATVHPLDVVQTGGSLYQSPGYSNGSVLPGFGGLPTLDTIAGGVASGAGLGTTVVNLQIDSKTVGNVIIQNGRVVAQGAINAMKANAGRRELTALQLSPSLVMS